MLFTAPSRTTEEEDVLGRIDESRLSVRYAVVQEPRRWTGLLRRNLFARAIQSSNSIEGYNVTLEDALAAVDNEAPLEAGDVDWGAVNGYRAAMTYVLTLAKDPHFSYNQALVRSLHYMMLQNDLSKRPGTYRPGDVYVRRSSDGEIVYEAPDADRVPELMHELMHDLNQEGDRTPAMIRAAMAHLNLALIHPFKDGNGRIARGLQTLVLAREGILEAEFSSIEEYLGRNTAAYYAVLQEVARGYWQPANNARPWIRFCLTAHYRQARTIQRRLRESERLWGLLSDEIAQRGLPERTIFALFEAANDLKIRRATYRPIAEVSDNLASRDLKTLVDGGLLIPHGEKRGRYYVASAPLRAMKGRTVGVKEPIEDPFEKAQVEHEI